MSAELAARDVLQQQSHVYGGTWADRPQAAAGIDMPDSSVLMPSLFNTAVIPHTEPIQPLTNDEVRSMITRPVVDMEKIIRVSVRKEMRQIRNEVRSLEKAMNRIRARKNTADIYDKYPQDIPRDPPEIVTKNDEGFSLDTNNMNEGWPYLMTFRDSTYVMWKTGKGDVLIKEV